MGTVYTVESAGNFYWHLGAPELTSLVPQEFVALQKVNQQIKLQTWDTWKTDCLILSNNRVLNYGVIEMLMIVGAANATYKMYMAQLNATTSRIAVPRIQLRSVLLFQNLLEK